MQNNSLRIIFFGTSEYAVMVLDELVRHNYEPVLVVTTPDKPAGRHLELTPSPVKTYALEHNLSFIQPENLRDSSIISQLKNPNSDVGVVVAYGKIIPQEIIDLPLHGLLNVHASLLPKLRGASPIETAILEDQKNTGVTIMQVDAKMDHGPIIIQEEVKVTPWPPEAKILGQALVKKGAELLIKILPEYVNGKITPQPQDDSLASYTKKIEKQDGLINLTDDPYKNFLKIQAYHEWPTAYFFVEKNAKKIRVIIKKAELRDNTLHILRVVPEGKKEMSYEDFKRSLNS